jgi:hypothetical protein
MKLQLFLTALLFTVFVFTKSQAAKPDTLSLSEYLKLFDNKFTSKYNIGWTNSINDKPIVFTFDTSKFLNKCCIRLGNGSVICPEIYGWAYSYKQINKDLFWLTYYREGEVGVNLYLRALDIKKKTFSEPYTLAWAGGDGGHWWYKIGSFINDSTFDYYQVHKMEFEIFDSISGQYSSIPKTLDSVSGIDRIRVNGEVIELKKTKLIK